MKKCTIVLFLLTACSNPEPSYFQGCYDAGTKIFTESGLAMDYACKELEEEIRDERSIEDE